MIRLVRLWDRLARRFLAIRPAGEGAVLGYALRRYPGRGITMADGAALRRGDLVLELHLDSRLLAAETAGDTAHRRILRLRRELIADLRALTARVEGDPQLAAVKGLWGLTLLNRGVEFLGFTVADLPPGPGRALATWYMRLLLTAYHPEGGGRLQRRQEALVAKEIFLPMAVLLGRYGSGGPGTRRPHFGAGE